MFCEGAGVRRNREQAFTIVELLIVIVVIAILAALVVVAFNGIQARARDTQRGANLQSLAKALEAYYAEKGSYPPFSQPGDIGLNIASWRSANLPSVRDSLVTPPGVGSVSLVNSATPTVAQYGYRNGESCVQCPRFFLYWRSDASGQVQIISSLHGQ